MGAGRGYWGGGRICLHFVCCSPKHFSFLLFAPQIVSLAFTFCIFMIFNCTQIIFEMAIFVKVILNYLLQKSFGASFSKISKT